MKTNKLLIFASLLGLILLAFQACQPEEYSLGEMISKDKLQFNITQNPDDPNMVLLESQTPGVAPMWITPTGRSQKMVDTVRLPFPGDYNFIYGVESAGGFVQADTVVVSITTTNTNYIKDPLWKKLTGGVGESKTWILDNGSYGLANGPLSYADPSLEQVWGNYQTNWDPAGSDVGATDDDYQAEMTFDLIDGAHIKTVKPNEPVGSESGVFNMNINNHTLSITDATIIRLAAFIPNATNWNNNLKILELTENQLRIAVMRTNEEGSWWYIFNYVSKDYAENYVPEDVPDPNFDFGDQMTILAGATSKTWKLSTETPFNWTDLTGTFLNSWYAITDYPDWTGYNADAIPNIENIRMEFTKTGDVIITNNDGTTETGTFSVTEKTNLVTFNGVKPTFLISGGWVTATTTDYFEDEAGNVITGDNQWKIVKVQSMAGIATDVWFGKRDTQKDEYMVYHFVLAGNIPDFKREVTKALAGGIVGTTSRIFKIDLNWPVDWKNPLGVGWTEPGVMADWYWSNDIAASVADQRLTFTQINGEITATKVDEEGNTTTSNVTIDASNRTITISDMDIIKFGAGSWLNTSGPTYYVMSYDFQNVVNSGVWLGVKTGDTEYTSYHYIVAE